jgi:hypothetical protein
MSNEPVSFVEAETAASDEAPSAIAPAAPAAASAANAANGTGWRYTSRRRAFLGHLGISAAFVAVAFAAVFFLWYPHPYFKPAGAANIVRVLVFVDLCLGPLLTLVVFKPGKKSLVFDMSCIAIMQIAAFVYGVTVLYSGRPYYNVFAVDRFYLLAPADIPAEYFRDELVAPERIGAKPALAPLLVAAVVPDDPARQQQLLTETVFEGKPDIERRPELWQPYAQQTAAALAKARPLSDLVAARPDAADRIAKFAARLERDVAELEFLPLVARGSDSAIVLDPATGEPLGVLDVDPWL